MIGVVGSVVRRMLHATRKAPARRFAPATSSAPAADESPWPADLPLADRTMLLRASAFTMTSRERQVALLEAVRYVVGRGIDGAFVECGVWRGGSAMIMAMALTELGVRDRDLYLFDTYDGMTPPTDADRSFDGLSAREQLASQPKEQTASMWCRAGIDDVRDAMASTGYPAERIHFVEGPVERTIPGASPPAIALLRLDTDWYESTRHEMRHLFPLLSPNGVLIIDDYGHWQGARRAIDEYFHEQRACYLMQRLDYTGRMLIKN